MRKLALAGLIATVVIAAPASAQTYPSDTQISDPRGDVSVKKKKVPGNGDIDLRKAEYQYYSTTGKPDIWFEYLVRRVKPERPTTQLYMTEFAVGRYRYRLYANDLGTATLYWNYGGSWIQKDNCYTWAAINPGSSQFGGNVATGINDCFRKKARVKILYSEMTNYPRGSLKYVARDRMKVARFIQDS
jgi:hypothetical protein